MAKIKGAIVVDTERCKGCNLCVVASARCNITHQRGECKGVQLCPPSIGRYLQRMQLVCNGLSGRMYLCV